MKKLLWSILAAALVGFGTTAHADSITATISGDDNISYWNGSSWIAEGTAWPTAETFNINVNSSSAIAYFAVSNNNWYPGGDPAGLIASFTDTNGTFANGSTTLVSNSSFEVLPWTAFNSNLPGPVPLSEINPTIAPPTTGYVAATEYGANGDPSTIWYNNNGGPVSGIDPNAQWIWSANNDGTYGTQDDYDFIAVPVGTDPVPEPPTFLLFFFAGALLLVLNRKKLFSAAV